MRASTPWGGIYLGEAIRHFGCYECHIEFPVIRWNRDAHMSNDEGF